MGAQGYAHSPVGLLSGGEQQRLRVAQAVSELIDRRRKTHDTAVVFTTHEVNPVLHMVNRVLYLVNGRFRIGTVDEVMTSQSLSELYQAPVQVLHAGGRLIAVGGNDHPHHLTSPEPEMELP